MIPSARMKRLGHIGGLLQKDEEDGHDEAEEGGDVVPVEGLAFEQDGDDDGEDNEGDDLLNDFQLHEAEGAAVAGEAETIGRNLGAIFKKRKPPGEEDDQNERPAGRNLHLLKLQMTIPCECHEYVGQHQQKNRSYCSHCLRWLISAQR